MSAGSGYLNRGQSVSGVSKDAVNNLVHERGYIACSPATVHDLRFSTSSTGAERHARLPQFSRGRRDTGLLRDSRQPPWRCN
jgi:hypothetical protein